MSLELIFPISTSRLTTTLQHYIELELDVDLERFCIKFFARPGTNIDEAILIEIFHEWIRLHKLKGTLIDVADYRHVPEGPGVMLISHEINYAMDHGDDQLGIYAQLKLGQEATHRDRIVNLVRSVASFGQLIEHDARMAGQLSFEGGKFHYMPNDRLQAPNTDEAFADLQPDLEAATTQIYPGQTVSVTRLQNDPRDRLTAVIETGQAIDMSALVAST